MRSDIDSLVPLESESEELIRESDEHLEKLRTARFKLRQKSESKKTIPPPPSWLDPNPTPENAG
jgi:hypothetical protein